ncbi:endonuclease/exonuclease/phosphatase family protein [Jiella marina]|uniref:endonuclease/exonuclease/phosphatase family protein n=1 Tax=Jiella sp. LLJ827 TaxID=2917712 RepID=UPI00210128FB|nr:endonuclease/exonuclease/phosphatase family protein [Jiella sp. LLJ827]MCQ0987366.1 endonuclease/exonuclease/phosphatase family protein [Jiella sp. LLJ827]
MKTAGLASLVLSAVFLAAISLLPLIETNIWWIRYLDFVRLQAAIALLIILAAAGLLQAWHSRWGALAMALCAIALGFQLYKLYPYAPVVTPMAVKAETCPEGRSFSVMVSNVQKGNRNFEAFADVVRNADPDILLALETDEWWDDKLKVFADRFPETIQSIPQEAEYFGLHLMSKYPLSDPEIEFFFAERTPSVRAEVQLPDGTFTLFGIHPRPPLYFDQPSALRDGTMAKMALAAAEADRPMVVAGDFNAVSWERIFRRAMRVGGLLDPRVGRGLFPTYDATNPAMAWPLDHILFQDAIGLQTFRKLPAVGSDHYPVMAELCLSSGLADRQHAPSPTRHDIEELRHAVETADALTGGEFKTE